ncbi:uncharacterized protein [Euwallacea similis]|uniref:uncharacterized protein n=1 Tax=Euwallacea similis TaxID=1736056 RepID=UPI00344B2827
MSNLPSPENFEETVILPFRLDNPKFIKITQQLREPAQIKCIHLLTKPKKLTQDLQVEQELNDHLERHQRDENIKNEELKAPILGPVIAESFDGTKTIIPLMFDDYFRLTSTEIWDNEEWGREADVVTMEWKMKDAAPYNVFYNTLKHSPKTHEQPQSIDIIDLLCPSLGVLKDSLHITYMVKIWWLLGNYAARKLHKLPMTILHGYEDCPWPEPHTMQEFFPRINYHFIDLKKQGHFGHHHTKLSVFVYEDDSLRIVVGTANLFGADWELYNNQFWVSPRCHRLPPESPVTNGESPTGFKAALLKYLSEYNNKDVNIPGMQVWIDRVAMADFSNIKVVLVFNLPGIHNARANGCMLHYMGHVLSQHCTMPAPKTEHDLWKIVAQSSSIGLIGRDGPEEWLAPSLLRALSSNVENKYFPTIKIKSKVEFSLVFASMENCLNGYLGYLSGICGKFEKGLVEDQPWLKQYMCQWKADSSARSRALPHSKCYCRVSPCWEKLAFYFITSSNLSRSGWGKLPNKNATIYIRSYEMGVLFLPKFFGEKYFETKNMLSNRMNARVFPMPFDLPLKPYRPEDEPYCWENMLIRVGLTQPEFKRTINPVRDTQNVGKYGFISGDSNRSKRWFGERKFDKKDHRMREVISFNKHPNQVDHHGTPRKSSPVPIKERKGHRSHNASPSPLSGNFDSNLSFSPISLESQDFPHWNAQASSQPHKASFGFNSQTSHFPNSFSPSPFMSSPNHHNAPHPVRNAQNMINIQSAQFPNQGYNNRLPLQNSCYSAQHYGAQEGCYDGLRPSISTQSLQDFNNYSARPFSPHNNGFIGMKLSNSTQSLHNYGYHTAKSSSSPRPLNTAYNGGFSGEQRSPQSLREARSFQTKPESKFNDKLPKNLFFPTFN